MAEDLFEVYGVTKPEEPQEAPQEEPAENAEEMQEPDAGAPEADEGAEKPKQSGQSKEENAKYAKARRKAEQERDAAIAEIDRKWQERIKRMGIENPYTNKPIESWEDYEAYQAQHEDKKRETFIRQHDMTEDEYRDMVDGLPDVQKAKADQAEAQKILDAEKQRQMREQVNREIQEIAKMNPAISSVEALVQDEKYEQILERIQKDPNISLADAYRLEHFDDLAARRGRQQAINAAGKSHMGRTQGRGEGSLRVPESVMRNYRSLVPGATEEQIVQHYNRMMRASSSEE